MSSATVFFNSIVKPTVEEFIASPLNIRRGLLSAIVLNQMTDYWTIEKGCNLKNYRNQLSKNNPDYSFVNDVADATKHAQLTNKSRQVHDSSQVTRTPGLFDAPFGYGFFAEACIVFAILNDGTEKPLLPAVESVLKMWEEILRSCLETPS
ncbi:conserved hypothetical protein [Crenothrix polyspora]|jgi:hypothetical protein|uniref:Uncharacterized protein n=1 Tax=Crenothrix polyspora TaxID=360316 RepID=A0A1R4H132_9GAMM|nr:hypothetical protein [Crenothrix polyspora]SJM89925.1 conserved hypothetical protein [Crenothrix polyspora]